jgi:hypothetical protein
MKSDPGLEDCRTGIISVSLVAPASPRRPRGRPRSWPVPADAQSSILPKLGKVSTSGDHFPPILEAGTSKNGCAYDNRAVGRLALGDGVCALTRCRTANPGSGVRRRRAGGGRSPVEARGWNGVVPSDFGEGYSAVGQVQFGLWAYCRRRWQQSPVGHGALHDVTPRSDFAGLTPRSGSGALVDTPHAVCTSALPAGARWRIRCHHPLTELWTAPQVPCWARTSPPAGGSCASR